MTVFDLFIFLVNLSLGVLVGSWVGSRLGLLPGIFGGILGFLAGASGFLVLGALIRLWYRFRPLRPICYSGVCGPDDYEVVEANAQGAVFRCRCGTEYAYDIAAGRRFLRITEDGQRRAYMKWSLRKGWVKDE